MRIEDVVKISGHSLKGTKLILNPVINDTMENRHEASLAALLKNYRKHISLSKKQLSGIIDASMDKVKKHADVLSINIENSLFLSRLQGTDHIPK